MNDLEDLDAIANLIALCRDSARAHEEGTLSYHLDMAFVAARGDIDRSDPDPRSRSAEDILVGFRKPGPAIPRTLDLAEIRAAVEDCRDRARGLDRDILVYFLEMALVTAREAQSNQP